MELYELSLFKGMDERECYQILNCLGARMVSFVPGEVLLHYDASSSRVGVVREGTMRLVRICENGDESLLEVFPEDSIFGETLAFSGERAQNLQLIADTHGAVLFIDYAHITKRCKSACACHALLLENVLRMISKKNLSLSERITIITNRTIREKLLCCFQMMASKQGRQTFVLPSGFSALADYLCVDRSAMTREMSKMKREGILKIDKRTITLLS